MHDGVTNSPSSEVTETDYHLPGFPETQQNRVRLVDYSSSDDEESSASASTAGESNSVPHLSVTSDELPQGGHSESQSRGIMVCNTGEYGSLPPTLDAPDDHLQQGTDSASTGITVYSNLCGDRGKNRRWPCYFCGRLVYQMSRHLRRIHGSEAEMAEVFGQLSREDVMLGLQKLAYMGLFKYNCSVLQRGSGILLVARSPKTRRPPTDFLPCAFCYRFYMKLDLYRHCQNCRYRPVYAPDKNVIAAGRAMLEGFVYDVTKVSAELDKSVISRMRDDRLRRTAVGDPLIVKLATVLLQKLGHERAVDVCSRMYELAGLLIHLQEEHELRVSISDLLSRKNFDQVVCGIEQVADLNMSANGRRVFGCPAYVIKVTSSLLKCAYMKRGSALRTGDNVSYKETEDFLHLYRREITDRLLPAAHAAYKMEKSKLSH